MKAIAGKLGHKLAKRARRARNRVYWAWRNTVSRARIARELPAGVPIAKPIADLNRYEMQVCSQHGEDGILEAIFRAIGTAGKYCVEFGAGSGRECNSAYLVRKQGWRGLWMDGNPRKSAASSGAVLVRQEFITADNISALFAKHGVPREFDLLSIDIDGNDYWVWKNLVEYQPRVVVVEYNAAVPPTEARVIAYDPAFIWQKTDYYGASLLALERLGRAKGYTLVACDESGANAFFVERKLAAGAFVPHSVSALYKPATYRGGGGHPPDPVRKMIPAPEL